MPTVPQINAAKTQLLPTPYDAASSKMTDEAADILHTFLVKYLSDTHKTGRYVDLAARISAAVGIKAAQLQAVLNNVSAEGSKKATLKGELEYLTQDTIDNELKFALVTMYQPVSDVTMGSMPSNMATAIRSTFYGRSCGCDEYHTTRCKDLQ